MPGITREQLGAVWRLAIPYFRSRDRSVVRVGPLGSWTLKEAWLGRGLLIAVIAAECAQVWLYVLYNQWNAVFFDALQNKDLPVFWQQLISFSAIAAAFIIIAVYQLYLNQWLQIRWRRWMTRHYLDNWLKDGAHYRMRLTGDSADNPDQRIADDIAVFIEQTLSLGVGLLSALTTLASFTVILWGISGSVPLSVGGYTFAITGYLVWIAAAFSLMATVGAHLIGRTLIGLNFYKQRLAADFRYALVRVRENSEQIALMRGEAAEHGQLSTRFANIVGNWHAIMSRQKTLTFFTAGYNQIAVILPYALLARPFFTGQIQLGTLMQTANAFGQVQSSFSYFVGAYSRLAEWKAVVDRLSGFEAQTRLARANASNCGVELGSGRAETPLCLTDVHVATPEGAPLLTATYFAIDAGNALLLKGSSGCGKSTLLRTICGFWPHSRGRVLLAPGTRVLALPQRPYLPLGTLRAVVTYPAMEHALADDKICDALVDVGLGELAQSLDRCAHWSDILSLGEQQRVGFARALLMRSDVLLLDEATSALDEQSEAVLFLMLRAQLPKAAIISIGHRSTLSALHHRTVDLDQRLTVVRAA
jgi:vitamin B12/bleomycin/antimicrobial peptide transport system ATP-binding/permease protein